MATFLIWEDLRQVLAEDLGDGSPIRVTLGTVKGDQFLRDEQQGMVRAEPLFSFEGDHPVLESGYTLVRAGPGRAPVLDDLPWQAFSALGPATASVPPRRP